METAGINLAKVAEILRVVAHPVRLQMICLMDNDAEHSVSALAQATGCEQSLVSHHLNAMRLRGLISPRREGKQVFYSLKEKELLSLMGCLQKCKCNFA